MRYIGSKERVMPFIKKVVVDVIGNLKAKVMADLLTGTTSAACNFKKLGAKLITNDYMSFSYAFQIAYICNNSYPNFKGLTGIDDNSYIGVLNYLNHICGVRGFIYEEYTLEGTKSKKYARNYFSEENAKRIDAIRLQIGEWYQHSQITSEEYYVLLASLIEAVTKVSNTSGTYGAFLKFDEARKKRDLMLTPLEVIGSDYEHMCYCEDIFTLINNVTGDVLYLDPPYNNRQYPPYYHVLETLTLYDNPPIYGKTGRRPYKDKLSPFCIKNKAGNALMEIIQKAQFEHIFLSYNTDGIVKMDEIKSILNEFGPVKVFDYTYRRYKSNSNGTAKNEDLKEQIFYVRK